MKILSRSIVSILTFLMIFNISLFSQNKNSGIVIPNDLSNIRGFNYTPANVAPPRHHVDTWIKYDKAVIEFDLDLAKRLNLNQVRVFVPYQVYIEDKAGLTEKLRHFVRESYKRGIGVMPVVGSGGWIKDTTLRPQAEEWVKYLVSAISKEPGLIMWDAMNEPDWPKFPKELVTTKYDNAIFMAKTFHKFDKKTPVTIGWAFVEGMITSADYVDILQFHDYMETAGQIRDTINRAKQFADKVGKPFFNGEIGCMGRANPYDITLKEHMDAKVGWYIWELMIVRKGWGDVHGVFYEDGTVRDPSIAAAIMGFFRNRESNILPYFPDKEGWVTKMVNKTYTWLGKPDGSWDEGLYLAETLANLLESGELIAMYELPTREVKMLRQGKVNIPVLRATLLKYIRILEPYMKPVTQN
jgi:hypothetical protein